jgi:outer membrane protein OmpA-like peptidoglycan-associated protein
VDPGREPAAEAAPATPPPPPTAAAPAAATLGDGRSPLATEFLSMAPGTSPPGPGRARPVPGDARDAADHPAVPRYEGAKIDTYLQKEFDAGEMFFAAFDSNDKKGGASALLEGRRTDIRYEVPGNRSTLEIFRNYQAALKSAGYTTAFECERDACGILPSTFANSVRGTNVNNPARFFIAAFRRSDGARVNLAVTAYGDSPGISVRIVEPRAMEQAIKVVDAAGIGRDVASAGKAVLYAIQFDTDRASLKPESDAQLEEIADWLTRSGTKALVVGHTDSQGAFPYNVGLSERRAEAVVAALSGRYGVPKAQLTAFGNGMAAPVASNRTADGQARNRRVEVVEQP